MIAESCSGKLIDPLKPADGQFGITVNELTLAFLLHAKQHYQKYGKITDEVSCFKSAIRPLVELFGFEEAENFGPLAMKAVRQKMIEAGWCRNFINKSVSRIRQVFRYGVENELIHPVVLAKLKALSRSFVASLPMLYESRSYGSAANKRIENGTKRLASTSCRNHDTLNVDSARHSRRLAKMGHSRYCEE